MYITGWKVEGDVKNKVEGGAPNTYLKPGTGSKRNKICSQFPSIFNPNLYYIKCNDDYNEYAFQNELYAVKVNNKWLFKYGVYGGNCKTDDRRRLYLEYTMHGVENKIQKLYDKGIIINGNHINNDTTECDPLKHYTHCYHLNTNGLIGAQIGAWLHIMEMSGHRALVYYLQNYKKTNNQKNIVMSISDMAFVGDVAVKIKELIENKDPYLRDLYKKAYPNIRRISVKQLNELIKKASKGDELEQHELSLYSYLVEQGAENGNINNITIKFTKRSSLESEFFCPIYYKWNENDNINDILHNINGCITDYQRFICNNISQEHNPCKIDHISVFRNNNVIKPVIIGECNGKGDISNLNTNNDLPYIHDVKDLNIGTMWKNIIETQNTTGNDIYINNNGAFDLILEQPITDFDEILL